MPSGDAVLISENSNRPKIAELDDGSLAVSYLGLTGALNSETRIRYFSSDGMPLGTAYSVYEKPDGTSAIPSNILPLPSGDFLLTMSIFGLDSNLFGVFARIISADGSQLGELFQVNQSERGSQFGAEATGLDDGRFVITWHSPPSSGSYDNVMMRLYDNDGTPSTGEIRVNQYSYNSQSYPEIATLTGGSFVITWQSRGQDGSDRGVYARIYAANGVAQTSEFRVNQLTENDQQRPGIAARPDGGFSVVWEHEVAPYQSVVMMRDFDSDGVALTDEYILPVGEGVFQLFPEIAIGATGEAFVVSLSGDGGTSSYEVLVNASGFTVEGGETSDLLEGSRSSDWIEAGDGNDTVRAGDGVDTIIGGLGDDLIFGGETEGDQRDLVYGGDGDDSIDGGYGNDELRGDSGNDAIVGGFGVDTLIGGTGDDVLTGQAWSDLIFGGDGNDFINGGFGFDRVNGGAGADRFYHLGTRDHGADWIQDYDAADGDVLVFGGTATRDQFQVNLAETINAGATGVEEVFVIYRPTGQIVWALIDGGGQEEIWLSLHGESFDLLS